MDNYYSGSDAVLIGSLCGGIGAVLLGIGIGICIVCYAKRKASRVSVAYGMFGPGGGADKCIL